MLQRCWWLNGEGSPGVFHSEPKLWLLFLKIPDEVCNIASSFNAFFAFRASVLISYFLKKTIVEILKTKLGQFLNKNANILYT